MCYRFPTSLEQMTLSQLIAFGREYGFNHTVCKHLWNRIF